MCGKGKAPLVGSQYPPALLVHSSPAHAAYKGVLCCWKCDLGLEQPKKHLLALVWVRWWHRGTARRPSHGWGWVISFHFIHESPCVAQQPQSNEVYVVNGDVGLQAGVLPWPRCSFNSGLPLGAHSSRHQRPNPASPISLESNHQQVTATQRFSCCAQEIGLTTNLPKLEGRVIAYEAITQEVQFLFPALPVGTVWSVMRCNWTLFPSCEMGTILLISQLLYTDWTVFGVGITTTPQPLCSLR